jgi:hypothetical protein
MHPLSREAFLSNIWRSPRRHGNVCPASSLSCFSNCMEARRLDTDGSHPGASVDELETWALEVLWEGTRCALPWSTHNSSHHCGVDSPRQKAETDTVKLPLKPALHVARRNSDLQRFRECKRFHPIIPMVRSKIPNASQSTIHFCTVY